MNRRKIFSVVLTHVVLVTLCVAFVMPLLWMFSTSLKPIEETLTSPPKWVPSQLLWDNYPKAVRYNSEQLGYIPLLVYARNTIIVTGINIPSQAPDFRRSRRLTPFSSASFGSSGPVSFFFAMSNPPNRQQAAEST